MRRGVQVSFGERNPTRDLAPYSAYVDLKLNINIDGVTARLPRNFNFLWWSKKIHSALTPAPDMNSLSNKYNGMRRGVQVSSGERNPTRDLAPYSAYVDLV